MEEKIEGLQSHVEQLERIAEQGEKRNIIDIAGHIQTVKQAAEVSRAMFEDVTGLLREMAERIERLEDYRGV